MDAQTVSSHWWKPFFKGPYAEIQRLDATRVEKTSRQVDALIRLMDLKPGHAVLDAPCGVGRHAIELARRGLKVTGVDLNDEAVDLARRRAKEEGVIVDFQVGDMRYLNDQRPVRCCIVLFRELWLLQRPGQRDPRRKHCPVSEARWSFSHRDVDRGVPCSTVSGAGLGVVS